jgi:hypothetical protein
MPESLVKESVTGSASHHLAINLPEKIALGAVLGIATGVVFGERAAVLRPIGDAHHVTGLLSKPGCSCRALPG